MVRIRRFGVVQTANVVAAIYAVVILVVFLPIAALIAVVGRDSQFGGAGALAVIVGGLFFAGLYAVATWIMAALGAALYNVVAGKVGGIEIQLENATPPAPTVAASWGQPSSAAAAPAPPAAPSAIPPPGTTPPPTAPPETPGT